MSANKKSFLTGKTVSAIVGMVIAYILLGKLALLLVIAPGYSTALFPSAGVAVAAVLIWGRQLLPGVFLGALLLNLWINLEAGYPLLSVATFVALGIATGALLQATVATSLLRLYVGFPNPLSGEKEIICFLTLAGPLACLISATVGTTALLFGNIIAPESFLLNWLTWWVGDVIGVTIMAPLLLILFAQPKQLWRQRLPTVALPMLVSCVLVVAVFIRVSHSEVERIQSRFHDESAAMSEVVKSQLNGYRNELLALERLYAASTFVNRDEFRSFVTPILINHAGLQALEWLPRVPHSQRQLFENQMRENSYYQYRLTEKDSSQNIVTAGVRDEYFPVAYVEPYIGNERVLGYDVASDPERLAGLVQARDSGAITMTAPIELLQFGAMQKGALLLMPVYEKRPLPETPTLRQKHISGFLLGVFSFKYMIDAALAPYPKDSFQLVVNDITDAANAIPIYGDEGTLLNKKVQILGWRGSIQIGGRELQLSFTPSAKYINQHRSWQAWVVLAWGLLFTSMLGALLLIISGRASKVKQLVENQTLELRLILDNVVDGIITCNNNGVIESINHTAKQLLGYSNTDILNRPLIQIIPDVAKYEMAVWALKECFITRSCEAVAIHQNGTRLPIELGIREVILPARKFYTCTLRDLTEKKRLDRMRHQLTTMVNSELRTPITAIRGAVSLINNSMESPLPPSIDTLLKTVTANSVRLTHLINDITDAEQLESGDIRFNIQRHEIYTLTKKAIGLIRNTVKPHQIELRAQQTDRQMPLWANVDEQHFTQAMSTLLTTMVKLSPAAKRVVVTVAITDRWIEIQLSSQPPSISEEQETAATPEQGDPVYGSIGLSLNIVNIIIAKMGGETDFTSTTEDKSALCIRLPKAK